MRKLISLLLLSIAILPSFAFAQIKVSDTGLDATGEEVYGALTDDSENIGTYLGERVINPFFSVLGLLFLTLIIYGGVRWMTAGGEAGSVQKAKDILVRAVLGLLVILLAYGLTQFIFSAISQ